MNNLVIVESPTKSKKIEGFLGEGYTVKSSNGHIRDLSSKDMSIDIEHQYEPQYQVSDSKRKIVAELKKAVKEADVVWLASDEDREGEAIAWHLQETLGLDPTTTKRIVFNEITKTAILHAIENPRAIDMNLVDAQQARRVLDRLVGYEISPILWQKIKPSLSAGRVQSVAVRLIVEREEEIKQFVSKSYFRLTAQLLTDGGNTVVAELNRRFDTEEEARAMLESLVGCGLTVESVETKPSRRSPAPPFTTSTLQQEASRKLGIGVSRTMMLAQQLYENGHITYMRTDSVNLSDLALDMARNEATKRYGAEYVKTRRYQTKSKGAQEAHEAIRPTYMALSEIHGDSMQKRLYNLIWKRTIASQMADAELEKTNVTIGIERHDEKFVCQGEQVKFDGFLKVYIESSDDEQDDSREEGVLPHMRQGMAMDLVVADAAQHRTQHPPRYTEASLVKKLEELGIGRPSTYAPTISTIIKREYIAKEDREPVIIENKVLRLKDGKVEDMVKEEKTGAEKNKLFPTDIGIVVNAFLEEHFANIVDYGFTAAVEKDFDDIASGHQEWRKVIDRFYVPFHENITETQQNSHRASGSRLLGTDPASGKNVYAKIGKYGTMVQIGDAQSEEKPRFASMKKGQSIESITLEEALALFLLPRTIGTYEDKDVVVGVGRFGPYVRLGDKFFSLAKTDDPYNVDLPRCIQVIEDKRKADEEKIRQLEFYPHQIGMLNGLMVEANIGPYGPYLSWAGKNYKLPKDSEPLKMTVEEAAAIVNAKVKKAKKA